MISIHDERPRSLRSLIKGYRALMHTSWSVMLQYRAAVFTWTLWSLAVPIVQLSVWSAIIAVEGGMDGYDRENIIAYFLLQSIVFHMTTAWHVYEFSEYIRSGTLSMWLLRPFDPSHQFVTSNLSFKFVNLIWLTPIWIGLWVYFRPGITYSAARVIAFALGLLLAATLSFLWTHMWAMVAFWTVRAHSFYDLASTIGYLIGGGIAPVGLLPGFLQKISRYLPFYYMTGMPIEVGIGTAPPGAGWAGLGIALGWILAFYGAYRLLWSAGLKRYGAVGA